MVRDRDVGHESLRPDRPCYLLRARVPESILVSSIYNFLIAWCLFPCRLLTFWHSSRIRRLIGKPSSLHSPLCKADIGLVGGGPTVESDWYRCLDEEKFVTFFSDDSCCVREIIAKNLVSLLNFLFSGTMAKWNEPNAEYPVGGVWLKVSTDVSQLLRWPPPPWASTWIQQWGTWIQYQWRDWYGRFALAYLSQPAPGSAFSSGVSAWTAAKVWVQSIDTLEARKQLRNCLLEAGDPPDAAL